MGLKDDHNNKPWQNLNKKAVYCKNGEVLFILICVVYLLSVLLSVCVKNVPGSKVSNMYFVNDRGISNIDFGDTIVDQVLATWTQQ